MSFPTPPSVALPEWSSTPPGVNTVPVPTGTGQLSQTGWQVVPGQNYGPIPPYQYENWMKYSTWLWLQYASDGVTYLKNNSGIVTLNQVIITASSTYTPPSNLLYAQVEILAAGGGGGAGNGDNDITFGGGSGAYSKGFFSKAQLSASISITIGLPNTTNPSSFGSLITNVGHGRGGFSGAGAGGTASTSPNSFNIPGNNGFRPFLGSGSTPCSGDGANSIYGQGGRGVTLTGTNAIGNSGIGYGAGGGGGGGNPIFGGTNGGFGAPGVCIITEYLSI